MDEKYIKKARMYIGKHYKQNPVPEDRMRDLDRYSVGKDIDFRNEFIHDKDRILYSKAFRRLQHKAQVYAHKKGDHHRTRLTHTLEVVQISKSISIDLGLNEDLSEAIALGHDIGHTPFGHAGEETLDSILRGEDNLGGKLTYSLDFGGFKHNFNSLNIVELVERKYDGHYGLNLTWQVLDGIVKHTKIVKGSKSWDWTRFVNEKSFFDDLIGYSYPIGEESENINVPLTLEGQIVDISDEIAQIEHDLDDSFKNRTNMFDKDMFENMKIILDKTKDCVEGINCPNLSLFVNLYDDSITKINNVIKDNCDEEYLELKWNEIVDNIISYFIADVVKNSMKILYDNRRSNAKFFKKCEKRGVENSGVIKRLFVTGKLINFSDSAKCFYDFINKFIDNKIINSYEVNRFDGKAKFIIRQLFKAYYQNPKQMPKSQLKLLENLIKKNEKFGKLEINNKDISKISIVSDSLEDNLDYEDIDELIKSLKLENNDFKDSLEDIWSFEDPNYDINECLNIIVRGNESSKIKRYLENHYAYLYVISNYVAKMTDNYAENEYGELYLI